MFSFFSDQLSNIYISFRVQDGKDARGKCVNYFRYTKEGTSQSEALEMHELAALPAVQEGNIRIVVISDTHTRHADLTEVIPQCNVLVHCGDILFVGRRQSKDYQKSYLKDFNEWLGGNPSQKSIVIGGNHDHRLCEMGREKAKALFSNADYLENEGVTVENITFWASPVSIGRSANRAFQSQQFLDEAFTAAPDFTDFLITHGRYPPLEEKVQHRIHLSGHYHARYGVKQTGNLPNGDPVYSICASICDGNYHLTNLPVVIDFPLKAGVASL